MTLEEKAKEWRENYKPTGITCIERYDVTVETQAKPTKIIENPNPFRIKDGWYDLYLNDLENAYLAGVKENSIQWHDLRKDPNDLPVLETELLCQKYSGRCFIGYYNHPSRKFFSHETCKSYDIVRWADIGQFWSELLEGNETTFHCEIPTSDKE